MIREIRFEKIKSLAQRQNIVTWGELQSCLNVSKATVQRDADILCKAGVLQKTRGGVIYIHADTDPHELSLEDRESVNAPAKRRIAAAALAFVRRGTIVMMDSGSTVLELARQIPADMELSAITYSLSAAIELNRHPKIETYCSGGKLRKGFAACHGYLAEDMLSQFHASVCFLGADGVSPAGDVCEFNMYDVRPKQLMVQNSDQVVLLADHSKFSSSAFIHVTSLEHVDVLITDEPPEAELLRHLDRQKVRLIVAGE